MNSVQEFLQIVFIIFLFLLPALLMAALLRLPPVYRLALRNRSMRTGIVLGSGLLCFGIYYAALAWLAANAIYSINEFYFDSTFGLSSEITPANVDQFKWGVINELWLRGLFPANAGQRCFSESMAICQLADIASEISSPESFSFILLGLALFSAMVTMLLGWRFTRQARGA
jgi:hypothetical protein